MNKERILELASILRGNQLPAIKGHCAHFDMRSYFFVPYDYSREEPDWCGTRACLAGLTIIRWAPERLIIDEEGEVAIKSEDGQRSVDFFELARDILEINADQADDLFVPDWLDHAGVVTRDNEHAATVLERLARTGRVNWD